MRTAKIGPDLRLRFYQRGSSINRRGFIIARSTTEAVQNVDECLRTTSILKTGASIMKKMK